MYRPSTQIFGIIGLISVEASKKAAILYILKVLCPPLPTKGGWFYHPSTFQVKFFSKKKSFSLCPANIFLWNLFFCNIHLRVTPSLSAGLNDIHIQNILFSFIRLRGQRGGGQRLWDMFPTIKSTYFFLTPSLKQSIGSCQSSKKYILSEHVR